MKRYEYPQRGLTLFEVSVALSVAIAVMLSFTSFYLNIIERTAIEQTVFRAKLVYEGALAYRIDKKQWPSSITVLTSGGYIPGLAAKTSWGEDIFIGVGHPNLFMNIPTPSKPIANSIAARLPAAAAATGKLTVGDTVQVTIIPPGQEFSLASLQDLEGTRAWTGHHEAGNNDLTDVHTLKAKFIVPDEVQLGESCSAPAGEEDRTKPGKGARAIAEDDGLSVPVLCDGTKWVREDKNVLSNCEVCVGCIHLWEHFDEDFYEEDNYLGGDTAPQTFACANLTDDKWAFPSPSSRHLWCLYNGIVAVKFFCGSD